MSLSQYEQEQDDAHYFTEAFEAHLEYTYTDLGDGYYYDDEDGLVFTVDDDSVEFEGGEDGEGFYGYQSIVDDPDELCTIIGKLLSAGSE